MKTATLLSDVDAELVLKDQDERQLYAFVRDAWPILEPTTPFMPGWHLEAICDHLEAVTRGEIRRLLITVPPRHCKSLLASVFWPAWAWIRSPGIKWLYASYAQSLSTRDSVRCRRVIESPWYQARWGDRYELLGDQNEKLRYDNSALGFRIATSVGGAATGEGGEVIVCDDPVNIQEAHSPAVIEATTRWWDEVMSQRINDPRSSALVIIMQRVDERDLAAHVLSKEIYEHLCLPSEYEKTARTTSLGWRDPRREPGELLWPSRFGLNEIAAAKRDLGSYAFAAQHQQRPAPAEGGLVKRQWWKWYTTRPKQFDERLQSWDMAFKAKSDTDYVVGQTWGRVGADCYLLDQVRDRLSFTQTLQAVRSAAATWPQAWAKLVEDTANGPAVIDTLTREIPGLIAVKPEGGKVARLNAVSPLIEAGNVWLPHPDLAPWIQDFVEEVSVFPNGANDDQVDAMSQALMRLHTKGDSGITVGATQPKEADERLPHLPEFHSGTPIPEHAAAGCLRCQSRLAEVR